MADKPNIVDRAKYLVMDGESWWHTLSHTVRVAVIVGLLALGYGYYKGYKGRPIHVDAADAKFDLVNGDGKHHLLQIKHGAMTFDGKAVSTKDVPKLSFYGIELKPKMIGGITSSGNPAAGLGLEFAHLGPLNADLLATFPFVGVGVSYDIHIDKLHIDNSEVGIGVGRDLEAQENAIMIYFGVDL